MTMQQNYAMLSGSGPGSGQYREVPLKTRWDNLGITDLCFTVTTCVMVLLTDSTLKHRNALPHPPSITIPQP
jgi:hypothetical protein